MQHFYKKIYCYVIPSPPGCELVNLSWPRSLCRGRPAGIFSPSESFSFFLSHSLSSKVPDSLQSRYLAFSHFHSSFTRFPASSFFPAVHFSLLDLVPIIRFKHFHVLLPVFPNCCAARPIMLKPSASAPTVGPRHKGCRTS